MIANGIILIVYDLANIKKVGFSMEAYHQDKNKSMLKKGIWIFLLTFLSTYLINTQRYAIDDLLENSLQTIYGIIIMPATVMGLLAQFIIQPSLNQISEYIKQGKYRNLKILVMKLIGMVGVIGILAVIVAYFLGIPVLQFIYGLDLQAYLLPFMIIIVGAIFYSISFMLSTILIALRKNIVQTVIYGLISVISTIASYIVIQKMELIGASIIYSSSMFLLTVVFLCVLLKSLRDESQMQSDKE